MKTTILISVFVCIAFHSSLVHADCFRTVLQYFQCRDLQMEAELVTNELDISEKKYFPVQTQSGTNQLDNKFFETELGQMSVDDALRLFRIIYNVTDSEDCSREFCECVRSGVEDKRYRFGKLFETEDPSILEQIKQIVLEFNRKYPQDESQQSRPNPFDMERENLKSLTKFCSLFDITMERIWKNKEGQTCMQTHTNSPGKLIECALPLAHDANLKYMFTRIYADLDPSKQPSMAVCDLILTNISKCSTPIQHIYSLNVLALFSQEAFDNVKNLSAFSDSLMERARNYNSSEQYGRLSFLFSSLFLPAKWYVEVKTFGGANDTAYQGTVSKSQSGVLMFNSSQLSVVANWSVGTNRLRGFDSFDLTFNYSEKYPVFSRTLNFRDNDGQIIDCSIRDYEKPFELNWIRMVSKKNTFYRILAIVDLRSKTILRIDSNTIRMWAPVSLIKQATGVLVNGYSPTN